MVRQWCHKYCAYFYLFVHNSAKRSWPDILKKRYRQAESNLAKLKEMGAVILHGVDAKTMRLHTDLRMRRFDRVVFNFPHAGFRGKEEDRRVIRSVH